MVALLEREGHDCLLVDHGIKGTPVWKTIETVHRFKPDLIAYYFGYGTLEKDLVLADIFGEQFETVLVGPWSYCAPNALQNTNNVNYMTYGEFDHTVLDIADGKQPSKIDGLIWRDNKDFIKNAQRELCSGEELDKFPFVTDVYRRFLNLKDYRQTSLRHPFIDTITFRSCPFNCKFCCWIRALQHMDPKRYRGRSIKNIVEELWYIKNEIPEVKQIWFQDDTLPPIHAQNLSQAIIDEELNISWGGYSRATQDYETLKLMKDSGMRTLHVGYETSDPQVLQEINKGVSVQQMETFANHIRDLNLWTCAGFMIFPWQSRESVLNTIQWAKHKIRPRRFSFTQLFPYPGTPICDIISKYEATGHPMLSVDEMTELERIGFIELYLKNLPWIVDTLKFPREWGNVLIDAWSLLKFLVNG